MSLENKGRTKLDWSFLKDNIFLFIFSFLVFSFPLVFSLIKASTNSSRLKLELPKPHIISQDLGNVSITQNGTFMVNGRTIKREDLDKKLNDIKGIKDEKTSMTISPKKGAPTEAVVIVMDAMRRLGINGILAMEDD